MSLENNFNQAVREWMKYCRSKEVQLSSFSEPVRNCNAYRKIVSMGKEALPLIRRLYDTDISSEDEQGDGERDLSLAIIRGHGLVTAIKEIIGENFQIPEDTRGNLAAIEDYTKAWLDKNMHKYIPIS